MGFSARLKHFSLFGRAKIGEPKSLKCLERAEKPTETLAKQVITRHSKSNPIELNFNRTQSNSIHGLSSIEFGNRTKSMIGFDWVRFVRLSSSSEIELTESPVFDFVRLPNSIELNP